MDTSWVALILANICVSACTNPLPIPEEWPEDMMTLDTDTSACYGAGTHGYLEPKCPNNAIMAVQDIHVGAKLRADNCPEALLDWNGVLVDASNPSHVVDVDKCCFPDHENDCISSYSRAHPAMEYYLSTSGYNEALKSMETSWTKAACNESSFMEQTSYMYFNISCIERDRIGDLFSNATYTTNGDPFYLYNSDYPGPMTSSNGYSQCRVSSSSASLLMRSLDIRLVGNATECQQTLNISDSSSSVSWDCNTAPMFNITQHLFGNPVTVTFSNDLYGDGGQIWMGFYDPSSGPIQITCQTNISNPESTPTTTTGLSTTATGPSSSSTGYTTTSTRPVTHSTAKPNTGTTGPSSTSTGHSTTSTGPVTISTTKPYSGTTGPCFTSTGHSTTSTGPVIISTTEPNTGTTGLSSTSTEYSTISTGPVTISTTKPYTGTTGPSSTSTEYSTTSTGPVIISTTEPNTGTTGPFSASTEYSTTSTGPVIISTTEPNTVTTGPSSTSVTHTTNSTRHVTNPITPTGTTGPSTTSTGFNTTKTRPSTSTSNQITVSTSSESKPGSTDKSESSDTVSLETQPIFYLLIVVVVLLIIGISLFVAYMVVKFRRAKKDNGDRNETEETSLKEVHRSFSPPRISDDISDPVSSSTSSLEPCSPPSSPDSIANKPGLRSPPSSPDSIANKPGLRSPPSSPNSDTKGSSSINSESSGYFNISGVPCNYGASTSSDFEFIGCHGDRSKEDGTAKTSETIPNADSIAIKSDREDRNARNRMKTKPIPNFALQNESIPESDEESTGSEDRGFPENIGDIPNATEGPDQTTTTNQRAETKPVLKNVRHKRKRRVGPMQAKKRSKSASPTRKKKSPFKKRKRTQNN